MRYQPPDFVGLVVVCDGVGLGFGVVGGGFKVVELGAGAGAEDDDVLGCGLGAALVVLLVGDGFAPLPEFVLAPAADGDVLAV